MKVLFYQMTGLLVGLVIGLLSTVTALSLGAAYFLSTDKKKDTAGAVYGRKFSAKDSDPLEYVYHTEEDAETVLKTLNKHINADGKAFVSDLKSYLGLDSKARDNLMGWTDLTRTRIVRVRDGFLIEFSRPSAVVGGPQ